MILTVEEAAKEYFKGKISMWKLYQLVKERSIPTLQINSKKIYFNTKHLDEWLDNGCIMPDESQYGQLRQIK